MDPQGFTSLPKKFFLLRVFSKAFHDGSFTLFGRSSVTFSSNLRLHQNTEKLPPGSVIDFDRSGIPREHYAAGIAIIERRLAEKYQAGYVPDMQCSITPKGRSDLWSDSNHPNAAGNRIVADTILPELRKVLRR